MKAGQLRIWLDHHIAEWGADRDIFLSIPVQAGTRLVGFLGSAGLRDLRGLRARSDGRDLGVAFELVAESGAIGEQQLVPRPGDLEDDE